MTKRQATALLKSTDLLEVLELELSSAESTLDGIVSDILPRLAKALQVSDTVIARSGFHVSKTLHVRLQNLVQELGELADAASEARARLDAKGGELL